jgi:hypothetical protein
MVFQAAFYMTGDAA